MSDEPTDPRHQEFYDLAVRIALAWRAIRRGASASGLVGWLYGDGEESIEQGQMDTLDLLFTRPSWRMSDLAEALRIEPSTVTRAVQRLEKLGLAERRHSKDDGRVVEVMITEAGITAHGEVAERRSELMTHILRAYRSRELPVVADILERFVLAVDDFVATRSVTD